MKPALILVLLALMPVASAESPECAPEEAVEAYLAGDTLLESGQAEAAIASFEQAVAIYPDFYEAWSRLEWHYKSAGRFADAITAAEQQARIRPFMAEFSEYGINQYRRLLVTPESAMEALARSADFEPGSDDAIAACREAIRIHPEFLEAHTSLYQHYIRADDEAAAKKQLAEILPLDAEGAGAVMVDIMAHLKPDWLTEAYGKELGELFSRYVEETDRAEAPAEQTRPFTAAEESKILRAFEEQIAAINSIIDHHSDMKTASAMYRESPQLQDRLRSLAFVSIKAESGGPGNRPWYMYDFIDETERFQADNDMAYQPYCVFSRIARDLEVPGKRRGDWRVGLCEVTIERPFCSLGCATMFEFRIDIDIESTAYRFTVRIRAIDELADMAECTAPPGTIRNPDW